MRIQSLLTFREQKYRTKGFWTTGISDSLEVCNSESVINLKLSDSLEIVMESHHTL